MPLDPPPSKPRHLHYISTIRFDLRLYGVDVAAFFFLFLFLFFFFFLFSFFKLLFSILSSIWPFREIRLAVSSALFSPPIGVYSPPLHEPILSTTNFPRQWLHLSFVNDQRFVLLDVR